MGTTFCSLSKGPPESFAVIARIDTVSKSSMAKFNESGCGEHERTDSLTSIHGHAEQCDTWNCRNVNAVCDGICHPAADCVGWPRNNTLPTRYAAVNDVACGNKLTITNSIGLKRIISIDSVALIF
jgi:hypothetical protein